MEAAISAFVKGTFEEVPPSILEDVSEERVSILELVKQLGPHLTAESDAERTMAVSLLGRVVVHLTKTSRMHAQLNGQMIRTLTIFFSDKLDDAVTIASAAKQNENTHQPLVPASASVGAQQAAEQRTLALSQMLVDCLDALLALSGIGYDGNKPVGRDRFRGEDACIVSRALFRSLELRSHPQPLRHQVICLLDSLVARNRSGLLTMRRFSTESTSESSSPLPGSGFVHGYTKLVSGEKDPRNLLILFGIARVILVEWELDSQDVDAFYNIIFCYFPITFRLPPDDPFHITPDMLKESLRACISATPAFASMGMPLLLEKLGASGGSAKVDVLRTLQAVFPVYGRAACVANADAIWVHLKLDILQPTDDESAIAAQNTLTTLLQVTTGDAQRESLSSAPDTNPTQETNPNVSEQQEEQNPVSHTSESNSIYSSKPNQDLLDAVLNECKLNLSEPSKALAKTSLKLVQCLIDATPSTCSAAVQTVVTLLMNRLEEYPAEIEVILPLLAALTDLVQRVYQPVSDAPPTTKSSSESAPKFQSSLLPTYPEKVANSSSPEPSKAVRTYASDHRPLDAFHQQLFTTFLRGLEHNQDAAGLHGVVMMSQIPNLLQPKELESATEVIQQAFLQNAQDARLASFRDAALNGLMRIMRVHKRAIVNLTVPYLLSQLPYGLSQDANLPRIRLALGALAQLCTSPDLCDTFTVRLCALLDATCAEQIKAATSIGYACALLAAIQVCFEKKAIASHSDIPKYAERLPGRLVGLLRTDPMYIGADPVVVQHVCELLGVLIPSLTADKQSDLLKDAMNRITLPEPNAAWPIANRLTIVATVLVGMKHQAPFPGDPMQCLRKIWDFLLLRCDPSDSPKDTLAIQSSYFMLCALINKFIPLDKCKECIDQFWDSLRYSIASGNSSSAGTSVTSSGSLASNQTNAIYAWVWLARGLAARGSDLGFEMLNQLRTEVFATDMGLAAAGALRVLAKHDLLVSKPNGFQVRLLYKQRLIDRFLPELVQGYKTEAQLESIKSTYYLVAIANLLPAVPEATLASKVIELLPLLVHTLKIPDAHGRQAAADAIHKALMELPERTLEPGDPGKLESALYDHLSTLITSLLDQIQPKSHSPPSTRLAALHVLNAIVPRLDHDKLLAYRRDVVQTLGKPKQGVDDSRRSVRIAAVDCRDAWFRINTLE
ncbi:hypothetical protein MYAM1_003239 [Malassezia yamatoensis]|uniref:MMS19 nucleotide excision repair protein n=1 Tax=Malassezia yamatoensis TaxID=253288 RepID=A0AAJ5YU76_9BASI|nr:hypothetical protein MYAM1_003239 [Malassezia yamatoensis]